MPKIQKQSVKTAKKDRWDDKQFRFATSVIEHASKPLKIGSKEHDALKIAAMALHYIFTSVPLAEFENYTTNFNKPLSESQIKSADYGNI